MKIENQSSWTENKSWSTNKTTNFLDTSFCHDFREFLENSKILRPYSMHLDKKHKIEMKKMMTDPPQTYFLCKFTKIARSLLNALQITRNHLYFFEPLKAKTLLKSLNHSKFGGGVLFFPFVIVRFDITIRYRVHVLNYFASSWRGTNRSAALSLDFIVRNFADN